MTLRTVLVGRSPAWTLVRAALLAATLLVASRVAFSPVRAVGISMLPTYDEGQLLLLNRLAYRTTAPLRGDVVAIELAGGRAVLVKRIVGLPGERIRMAEGTLLVNDVPVAEPYVRYSARWTVDELQLQQDEYYVVGDNRAMPPEQHDFGSATRDRILGRLVW
jgi:signal peptidase I